MSNDTVQLLRAMFDAAVAAVSAPRILPPLLPANDGRPITLIAVGKAAAAMAEVACDLLPVERGLVVTRHGHVPPNYRPPASVRLIEADHPVPGQAGERAARDALALAQDLNAGDHLLALISGGGSALLPLPAPGLTLSDKQAITRALLNSGAPIRDINIVRQCLSAIKGGRLAAAAMPARVTSLLLSDVPGDDPSVIASGPTVASGATSDQARDILDHWRIARSPAVNRWLRDPRSAPPRLKGEVRNVIAAGSKDACHAAATLARRAGYRPVMLGDGPPATAADWAARHLAALASHPGRIAFISGGEADVAVPSPPPPGGRNLAFLLELALAVPPDGKLHAIACDTDGIDGSTELAGAILTPATIASIHTHRESSVQAARHGLALPLIKRWGVPVSTGPTFTNVNDLRIILVDP